MEISKSGKRVALYRAYAAVAMVGFNAFLGWLHLARTTHPIDPVFHLPLFGSIIFAVPAMFMVLSIGAFPFRYSMLGAYQRRAFPSEEPIVTKLAGGRVGLLGASHIRWTVFPSGLGFSIVGIGKGFLPREKIEEIELHLFGHTDNQIRSTLRVPRVI